MDDDRTYTFEVVLTQINESTGYVVTRRSMMVSAETFAQAEKRVLESGNVESYEFISTIEKDWVSG